MNEFDWIARYFAPLAGDGALGLKDDAALISSKPGMQLVVTTDALVEGKHFLPDMAPEKLAHKALAVNLSDLAAMGAKPIGYTVAIGVTDKVTEKWTEKFTQGLKTFGVNLLGGDTVKTDGPLFISITAIGEVTTGKALQRGKAQAGEDIYISGTIGNGWRGLEMLRGNLPAEKEAISKYETPTPRLVLGQKLVELGRESAVDISDGLLADISHIAEASNLTARLKLALIPVASQHAVMEQITGGDDYEIAFTAPQHKHADIKALSQELKLPLTIIGTMESLGQEYIILENDKGNPVKIAKKGFCHF